MRASVWLLAAAALAACAPTLPDSGAGAGASDYRSYEQQRAAREAALRGGGTGGQTGGQTAGQFGGQSGALPFGDAGQPATDPAPRRAISAEELSAAGLPVAGSAAPAPVDSAPLGAPLSAVSPAAQAPAAAAGAPDLAAYALSTRNQPGETVYTRKGLLSQNRTNQACAAYPTQDAAQSAFLAKGGPQRDPDELDPDGDGFACDWDPTPYRQAAR